MSTHYVLVVWNLPLDLVIWCDVLENYLAEGFKVCVHMYVTNVSMRV